MTDIRSESETADDLTSLAQRARQYIAEEPPQADGPQTLTDRFSITPYSGHGPAPLVVPVDDPVPQPRSANPDQQPRVADLGGYSWMFNLGGYQADPGLVKSLGAPCGPMDFNPPGQDEKCAQRGRSLKPEELKRYEARPASEDETDPAKAGIPAGYTYLGQFLDHNITFQAEATFDRNQVDEVTNFRSSRVDLAHVYGLGPKTQAFEYYDNQDNAKFWIDPNREFDVPRNDQDVPIIADPRNDNTIFTVQLHLAFMKFHNAVVEILRGSVNDSLLFARAQQEVVWHYQWIILNDWLPRIIDPVIYEKIMLEGPEFFHDDDRSSRLLPIEFSAAAYRLHSLVLEEYRLNDKKQGHLFRFRRPYSRLQRDDTIDWSYFFAMRGTPNPGLQYAKRFNAKIVHSFLQMPGPIDTPLQWVENPMGGEDNPHRRGEQYDPMRSIAIRNMLRGNTFSRDKGKAGLPSGQDVAKAVCNAYGCEKEPWSSEQLGMPKEWFGKPTPLWYYILREGAVASNDQENGSCKLGVVGSVIVGEVLHSLVSRDRNSYLNKCDWKPFLGAEKEKFSMSDLLHVAQLV
jgi:hypothetical protein